MTCLCRSAFKQKIVDCVRTGDGTALLALMSARVLRDGMAPTLLHESLGHVGMLVSDLMRAATDFPEALLRTLLDFRGPPPRCAHFVLTDPLTLGWSYQYVGAFEQSGTWTVTVWFFNKHWYPHAAALAHALALERARWSPLRSAWVTAAVARCADFDTKTKKMN